ncbi:MAG: RICIN domain-containing protein, partial [Planctomycetes bacterium]|nr:RICIN domain-containing protein [Planctomycetota bacterium]
MRPTAADAPKRLPTCAPRRLLLAMLGLCLWASAGSLGAEEWRNPVMYAVMAQAQANENPRSITLSWAWDSHGTGFRIARKAATASTWSPVATLGAAATSWTDSNVQTNTLYDYQIIRDLDVPAYNGSGFVAAYGYLRAGIRIAAVEQRGAIVLIVDASQASSPLLVDRLVRLQNDLIGDGWRVIRHDVQPTLPVAQVKALIQSAYNAAPAEVRSVLLFGHIAVPYSGDAENKPDGHEEHSGAWPCDGYYGDVVGGQLWTDSTASTAYAPGSHYPNNDNEPGDGKFDQNTFPSAVELAVGRVDLWDMPAFGKSEAALLAQYLDKDHAHRHGARVLQRRAMLDDSLGEWGGCAFVASGARAWSTIVGVDNVVGDYFMNALPTQEYLLYRGCGGGNIDSMMQHRGSQFDVTTAKFAEVDPKAAFYMMGGSIFGDWNMKNNLLRAPLATTTYGLTSCYSLWPACFLHTAALGGPVGEAIQETQNNTTFDLPWPQNYLQRNIHIALMGDPSLRLFAVKPASGLNLARNVQNNPVLTWNGSSDATSGYQIYRSTSAAGPFVRQASTNAASWTDTGATSGTYTYQVKAVKLETTGSGTFLNTSQAISVTTGTTSTLPPPAPAPNQPPVVGAGSAQSITLPTSSVTLTGTAYDTDGTVPNVMWTRISGPQATIVSPYSRTTRIDGLVAGSYVFRFSGWDNLDAGNSADVTVTVHPAATTNQAPVVDAGPYQTVTMPTTSVTLVATAIDSDGTIPNVLWGQIEGAAATIVSPYTRTTRVDGLDVGSYVFRFRVWDDQDASAWSEVTVTVQPAAAGIVAGSSYVLTAQCSGKALEVGGSAVHDGASINQWSTHGGMNQQWRMVDAGDGYWQLVARHSGKALDVSGSSLASGEKVHQWAAHTGHNQQWRIEPAGGGFHTLRARHSGKCLDVAWASTADGAAIQQYDGNGGAAQRWSLQLCSDI